MSRNLVVAVALAAALLPPAAASAAEPASGKVSASSPSAAWTGTLVRPYASHLIFNYEGTAGGIGTTPCEAPACDTYTLEVADGPADLTLLLSSEQTPDISLRIQHPDGSWTYHDGWSDAAKLTKVTLKKAANGTYTINVVARVFGTGNPTAVDDTADYKGTATLNVPKPVVAVPPAPPVTAAPPPAAPKPATSSPSASAKRKLAACKRKARKIRNAKKRRAALKRCSARAKRR